MKECVSAVFKKSRLIVIDVILLNFALLLSFYFRFDLEFHTYLKLTYFITLTILSFCVLYFSRLYNKMWKYASIEELLSIVKVSALINLILVLYIFLFQTSFPRSVLLINTVLTIFLLGLLRFSLRFCNDYLYKNKSMGIQTRVLIIGAGDAGEIIIREMNKHPEMQKEVVGLIDDDPEKSNLELHGIKILGNRYDLPLVIEKYLINEVIIAMPSVPGNEIKKIYNLANQDGVKVNIAPGMFEIINGDVNLKHIREVKVEDLLGRKQVNLDNQKIQKDVTGRNVLVTGAGGSIGSELCRQIARFSPQNLIMMDIYENNLYFLDLDLKEKYADYDNIEFTAVVGSIRDRDKLHSVFSRFQPDIVFHAAAHKHVPLMEYNPEEAVKNNIFGTRNLIEISDYYQIEKFVLISTDKAVNPTNVMGATKRAAEMLIQMMNKKSKTKYMAVRFGNVLGSNGSVIPLFKKQIKSGGPVTVTHKQVTRYFMTIPEAVQLVIQAGSLGSGGEVFVLDMGDQVKIYDLARDLIELSGFKVGEDIEIKITGLRPGEKLYEELLHDEENNITTEHERIFITKLEEINVVKMERLLKELAVDISANNTLALINTLKDMVETYNPKRDNIREITFEKSTGRELLGEKTS